MEEKFVCEICGKEVEESNIHDVDEGNICDDCYNENYMECDCCGKVYHKDELEKTECGEFVCQDCIDNEYYYCEDCGHLVHQDDIVHISDIDTYVCEDCADRNYYKCDDCGEYVSNVTYVEGDNICDCCLESGDYICCEGCGEYFHIDNIRYSENQDGYYCDDCYEDGIICGYHEHTNKIEFFGDDHGNSVPYLGIELEIDKGSNNTDCAETIQSYFPDNFIYFERDGSLDSGFENITQPATYDFHYKMKEQYENAFKAATRRGFRSHDTTTCGLHIHFDRDFFEEDEELYTTRLLYLVEKFWDELVKFSRRNISNLDRWAKKYDDSPENVVNTWKNSRWNLERYHAVNLTNTNTIEFRMFRGTLKLNTFIATLQLCNTLVMTARYIESTEAIQNLKWEDMLKYDEIKAYWEEVKDR